MKAAKTPAHRYRCAVVVLFAFAAVSFILIATSPLSHRHIEDTGHHHTQKLAEQLRAAAAESEKALTVPALAPAPELASVPTTTEPEWINFRPAWSGRVETDRRGLGSRIWSMLQPKVGDSATSKPSPVRTAAEAATFLLNASKEAAHQDSQGRLATTDVDSSLVVIQVGACDGAWESTNDPMQALLRDPHVRAIALEPVPPLFQELSKRLAELPEASRRLLAVNAAVCLEKAEAVPFYRVSQQFAVDHPEGAHWEKRELGAFNRRHLRKHGIPEKYIERIQVPCRTPANLLEISASPIGRDPARVDALMVDAEGLDGDLVIRFLDMQNFRPALIIFEHKHLTNKRLRPVLDTLRRLRYVYWKDDSQLVAVLAGPPAVEATRASMKARDSSVAVAIGSAARARISA